MSWKVTPAPRPKKAPASPGAKWVQAGVYLVILAGCVLVWMLEYDVPKIPLALLGAAIGAGVSIAVYLLPRPAALWLAGGGILAYAVTLFAMLDRVVLGASYASALVYSRFTEVFHRYVALAEAPFSRSGLAAFGVFLVFATALLAALLALAALGARSFWLSFAVCLPFFWFAYAKDGLPPVFPILALFCGWCALLLKGTASRLRPRQSALMQTGAMVLCFLVMGGALGVYGVAGYTESSGALAARAQLERVRDSFEGSVRTGDANGLLGDFGIGYGTGTVGSRSVTRVNLAKSGQLGFGSGNAFTITGLAPNSGTQYLRGFSCDVYTGTSWEQGAAAYPFAGSAFQPLTYDPYYNQPQAYIVPADVFGAGQSHFGFAAPPWPEALTIEYTEPPRYIHTPYALTAIGDGGDTVAFTRDAYLAPAASGTSFELYRDLAWDTSAVFVQDASPTASSSVQAFTDIPELVSVYYDADFSPESTWFEEADGTRYDFYEAPDEYRLWAEALQGGRVATFPELPDGPHNTQTAQEAADYHAFAMAQYTQLPTGVGDDLRAFAAWYGLDPAESEADWQQLAYLTGRLLRGFGRYTLRPGRMPSGSDFVTYFLRESQAGYCVHYASAGTAILRALGVPARYVEGYVIGTGGIREDQPLPVPKKNSHAWVEVFLPELGWVPLEVTPGGSHSAHPEDEASIEDDPAPADDASSAPDSSTPASESTSSAASQSASSSESTGQSTPDSSSPRGPGIGGTGGSGGGGIGLGPVLAVLGSLLAAAGLAALPGFVRQRRFRRFHQYDANTAVLSMYRYLEKLESFGYPPNREMLLLAEKARFSQHRIDSAECRQMLDELGKARASLLDTLPPFRRLWLYLRGL